MRTRARQPIVVVIVAVLSLLVAGPAAAGPEAPDGAAPPSGGGAAAPESAPEAALTNAIDVEVGYYHSCAIVTPNRQVRCWGWNASGELGVGNFNNQYDTAQEVRNAGNTANLTGVLQLALGDYHTCALLVNRQVRCWGENDDGELGNGDAPNDRNLPVAVRNGNNTANLANVRSIAAETDGTCAVLTNGEVRCWGDDDYGQLGNGNPLVDSDLPVPVKNTAGATGNLRNVVALGGGYDTQCAVLGNGQARCWGYNSYGGLGNYRNVDSPRPVVVRNAIGNGPLAGVTQISHNGYTGCARLANGQAWCWGDGEDGELGDGGGLHNPRPSRVRGLTNVRSVFLGWEHGCALLTTGQVRCWGSDEYGENGDGTIESPDFRRVPVAVRNPANSANLAGIVDLASNIAYHNCAVRNDGRVLCWGYGDYGHLGDGDTDDEPLPVVVQL